jgi:hypothetical protein
MAGINFTCEKCGGELNAKVRPEAGNLVSVSLCANCSQTAFYTVAMMKDFIAKFDSLNKVG